MTAESSGLPMSSPPGTAGPPLSGCFEALADLPSLIVSAGKTPESAITDCLASLGKLLGASRTYAMLDEKDGRYLRSIQEWISSEEETVSFSWQLYDYAQDIPSLPQLFDESAVIAAHIRDLPEDLQHVLGRQSVRSVLAAPLLRDGVRIGIAGADFCREERELCGRARKAIEYCAAVITLALERKDLLAMRAKLSAIQDIITDAVPVSDLERETPGSGKPMTLLDAERRIIIETLELYKGNKLKTARHLGLTWPSLDRRCKKLGIEAKKR